jgi:hypothetical protein
VETGLRSLRFRLRQTSARRTYSPLEHADGALEVWIRVDEFEKNLVGLIAPRGQSRVFT